MEIEKKNCLVWVGGIPIYDNPISRSEAELIELEYIEKGYDDVQIEEI